MSTHRLLSFAFILWCVGVVLSALGSDADQVVPGQTREDLLKARDAAWRAFFEKDPAAAIEKVIGPEVIAIQENEEKWDNRSHLIQVARAMQSQGIKVIRLEFPQTEIQVFGDTAILYYSYVFETGVEGKPSGVDAGRGTEVFVRREGRWVDVGWHLDNGAFSFKDDHWMKKGEHPAPRIGGD